MSNHAQPALNIDDSTLTILNPHMINRHNEALIFIGPDLYDWQHANAKYELIVAGGAPTYHPALEYWGRKSDDQHVRSTLYGEIMVEFARLVAAGLTTEAEMKALREQFEIAVLVLECWVEMNVELLASVQDIFYGLGEGRTWAAVREWLVGVQL